MHDPASDPRFLRGIDCFNRHAFFEAHEVWEEIWRQERGPARQFYKGLIQAAVCLHHFGNGNLHGARTLLRSGTGYLQPYRPAYLGIDVDRLLVEWERCCLPLRAGGEGTQLNPHSTPVLSRLPNASRSCGDADGGRLEGGASG